MGVILADFGRTVLSDPRCAAAAPGETAMKPRQGRVPARSAAAQFTEGREATK